MQESILSLSFSFFSVGVPCPKINVAHFLPANVQIVKNRKKINFRGILFLKVQCTLKI